MGIQDPGHRMVANTSQLKTGRRRFGVPTIILAVVLILSIAVALLLAFDPRM